MARDDQTEVAIEAGTASLQGTLTMVQDSTGLVVFAHGSGSSRRSPRNLFVARRLNELGLATLLFDLLTPEEEELDAYTGELRFDIELLAGRLVDALDWVARRPSLARLRVGTFGASTGAAGALIAAAERPRLVHAVVSRGGRPDLAGDALPRVRAPTLLIVGARDEPVIVLNERAAARMTASHEIQIVPGASHLFEEPGTLERVAELAGAWFTNALGRRPTAGGDARATRNASSSR